jgi:hypothetical protein
MAGRGCWAAAGMPRTGMATGRFGPLSRDGRSAYGRSRKRRGFTGPLTLARTSARPRTREAEDHRYLPPWMEGPVNQAEQNLGKTAWRLKRPLFSLMLPNVFSDL